MNPRARLAIDLKQLRYFAAVAEELHFGRAAARLGISQPPLSEHIKSLEATHGVRLFDRNKRRVALTASGRLLYAEASRLLAHSDRVQQVMSSASLGQLGELYLGCVPSALFGALPTIMKRIHASRSGIRLHVTEAHTAEILAAVADGRQDVGLVWEDKAPPRLAMTQLDKLAMMVALRTRHRLAKGPPIRLADIVAEPLILPPRETTPHQFDRIIAGFARSGLNPNIGHHVRSIPSQLGYVASGLGYALVPSYAERLSIPGVVLRPLRDRIESVPLSIVWNPANGSPQLETFVSEASRAFGL